MHYVILHVFDETRFRTMLEHTFPDRSVSVDTLRRTIDGHVFKVRDLSDNDLAELCKRIDLYYKRDIIVVSVDKPL